MAGYIPLVQTTWVLIAEDNDTYTVVCNYPREYPANMMVLTYTGKQLATRDWKEPQHVTIKEAREFLKATLEQEGLG